MDKFKKDVCIEDLFYKHCKNKSTAKAAVNAMKKVFGVDELSADQIMHIDLCNLCNANGIGRKTVLLVAEVACDLAKMK